MACFSLIEAIRRLASHSCGYDVLLVQNSCTDLRTEVIANFPNFASSHAANTLAHADGDPERGGLTSSPIVTLG